MITTTKPSEKPYDPKIQNKQHDYRFRLFTIVYAPVQKDRTIKQNVSNLKQNEAQSARAESTHKGVN